MADEGTDQWREVLREAIEGSKAPVIGTHYRTAVTIAAGKRALEFPPPDESDLKFIQLLERYPETISILRRPGQDFLVAPAGRSDLLAEGIKARLYGIRRELFDAFTLVGQKKPYYDKSIDTVVWHLQRESASPDTQVAIPAPSIESETQLRREFAAAVSTPAAQAQLQTALSNALPLQAFSAAIRDLALQKEWHGFRTERLVERIQKWAKDTGLEWNDAWLTPGPSENAARRTPANSEFAGSVDALRALLGGLDEADIQRISVPLDLVLKAMTAVRSR